MNQFMPLFRKKNQQIISQIFDLENTVVEATLTPPPVITCTGLSLNKNNKILYKIHHQGRSFIKYFIILIER